MRRRRGLSCWWRARRYSQARIPATPTPAWPEPPVPRDAAAGPREAVACATRGRGPSSADVHAGRHSFHEPHRRARRRRRRAARPARRRSRRSRARRCWTTRPPLRPPDAPLARPSPPAAPAPSGSRSQPSRPATRRPTSTSSPAAATPTPPSGRSASARTPAASRSSSSPRATRSRPSQLAAHPSASCVSNPADATRPPARRGGHPQGQRDPQRRRARAPLARDTQLLIDATDAPGRCHDQGALQRRGHPAGRARDHRRDQRGHSARDRDDQPHRRGAHRERRPAPAAHRLRGDLRLGGRRRARSKRTTRSAPARRVSTSTASRWWTCPRA